MGTVSVARSYVFQRSDPAALWIIVHNLGYNPIVAASIYDTNGILQDCLPKEVVHVDENTVHVEFSSPRAGVARLV